MKAYRIQYTKTRNGKTVYFVDIEATSRMEVIEEFYLRFPKCHIVGKIVEL